MSCAASESPKETLRKKTHFLQKPQPHHSSFTASQRKKQALELQFLSQIENLCSKTQLLRLQQQLRQPLPGNLVVKEEKRQKTFGHDTDMGLIK